MRLFENKDCIIGMKEYPDNYFDLAIVDPPYGTKQIKNNLHGKINWNENIPSDEYFNQLYRVSKDQFIFGANYFNKNIKGGGRIVWNKMLTPIYEKTFSHCEIIYTSKFKRTVIYNYQWSGNVQNGRMNTKNIGVDRRIHPTQKPIAIYYWLVQNYANSGDKILDTHVGSASSLIVFNELGFDFVGYEIEEKIYNKAIKRMKEYESQLLLFKPAGSGRQKTEQTTLFTKD